VSLSREHLNALLADQIADDGRPDKAGAAGHQHAHNDPLVDIR